MKTNQLINNWTAFILRFSSLFINSTCLDLVFEYHVFWRKRLVYEQNKNEKIRRIMNVDICLNKKVCPFTTEKILFDVRACHQHYLTNYSTKTFKYHKKYQDVAIT